MPNSLPGPDDTAVHRSNEVLWERVTNQDRALRALAEETTSQFRELRVENNQTAASLSAAIKALDTKMDANSKVAAEHSRPQYAALIGGMLAAVGVAVTIIQWQTGIHDKPVDDKILAIQTAIVDLTKNTTTAFADAAKTLTTEKEFNQTVEFQNRISDLKTNVTDKALARLQSQVDKIEGAEVSRAEHEVHWAALSKRDTEVQNEIAGLNTRLDQLAPAGETIRQLIAREHELEIRVLGAKPIQ